MMRAAIAATSPKRLETTNKPAVTAPAITAWSLGNEKSLVGVAKTSRCGWVT